MKAGSYLVAGLSQPPVADVPVLGLVGDADFTFDALRAWRDALTDALLGRGLGVASTDADERLNRVVVGVRVAGARSVVSAEAARLDIPAGALLIEDEGELALEDMAQVSGGIGAGAHYGGMPIYRQEPDQTLHACTLGFYATAGGAMVGVSNSHCSADRNSSQGDGTPFYAYVNGALTLLGVETHDRNFHDFCPTLLSPFRWCRYADAMMYTKNAGTPTATLLRLVRYTVLNTSGAAAPQYQVVDLANPIPMVSRYSAQAGEVVNKAGATTGWTQGTVTATCKDVEYTVSPIIFGLVIKCQHEANYARAGGDSGAPVYRLVGGGADLKGIHWARYLQVTGYKVVFSPLSGIEDDFGPLGGLPSGGPGSTPPDPSCNPIIAIEPCG